MNWKIVKQFVKEILKISVSWHSFMRDQRKADLKK